MTANLQYSSLALNFDFGLSTVEPPDEKKSEGKKKCGRGSTKGKRGKICDEEEEEKEGTKDKLFV